MKILTRKYFLTHLDCSDKADSYERLKAELEKEKNKANRLRLEVELITAKNRKDVRDRRRRVRSQSREYVIPISLASTTDRSN
jgi:hypothetical protein